MATNILVLGAGGQVARWVIQGLAGDADARLTLFLRDAGRLHDPVPGNARLVEGDVLDPATLADAMTEQDIVYANLTGDDIDDQARHIIAAMHKAKVGRLVFVLALGMHGELPPGFHAWNEAMIGEELKSFRRAAGEIEASGLKFTLLRPAWLQDEDTVDYETTEKGETFKGTEVSRRSVADLVLRILRNPSQHVGASLGINKPGTDGDRPSFY
jgi:uncharacterized protein YbjT (DUF2867 family)